MISELRKFNFVLFVFNTVILIEALPYHHTYYRTINQEVNQTVPVNTTKIKERILTHSIFPNEQLTNNEEYSGEQDIVFPDSFEVVFEPVPRIDTDPKCADGSTFCETVESYPRHYITDILRRSNTPVEFFGKDDEPKELINRIGEPDDETFICRSTNRLVFPQLALTKSNKWKYIINMGNEYAQGIQVETCVKQDRPCDIIGYVADGYITSCKQKYMYRRLLSINENKVPVPDTFKLPSACCCSYRRDTQFLARFGRQMINTGGGTTQIQIRP